LARRFFPSSSAVGHKLVMNGDTLTVTGVVRHARFYNVFEDDRGEVYLSHAQLPFQAMFYALRTIGNPEALARSARETVRSLDPAITVADLRSLEDIVRLSLGKHRLSLFLLAAFALGSMVLATLGIYGIIAHSVHRRTHEFGVRLALGAGRGGIVGLVMREGVRVIGVGVAAGVIGGLLASRVLAGLLYGMRAEDPLTFAGVAGFLALIALSACAIPAWRATRVPPAEALRTD
jgi:ABC-type antimicrobial peptide transport system permease subunit